MRYKTSAQIQDFNLSKAVDYHYGRFPPTDLDYERLIGPLQRAAAAIARYDAVLSGLHNKARDRKMLGLPPLPK